MSREDILRDAEIAAANGSTTAAALEETIAIFRRWLFLPDPAPLLAVLGTVAANLLEGDPVWLLLVGPPGSGKSELLNSVSTLANVHPTATLTEAALLSGTPKRDRDTTAKGGLLRSIGDFGIVLCKDFGSVLSMNRDARAAALAALREVYDGSWTRHVGTDGGRTLTWSGKVGLVAGCTPTIDKHYAVMGAMGERFVLFRLPEVDTAEQARRALAHARSGVKMRAELGQAVAQLFGFALTTGREPSSDDEDRLVALSELIVRCRSAVERDGYSREIELIPDAEAPTRLIVVLSQLLAGLDAIAVDRAEAWRVVTRAALDSIPATRLAVMQTLTETDTLDTASIATRLGYPTTTARRTLEDLTAHGVVNRFKQEANADVWQLTAWTRERFGSTMRFPDMSSNTRSGRYKGSPDISGTAAQSELEWR